MHQVVPGDPVTTTFSITATDSNGLAAADTTTSVTATAVNDPPVISGTTPGQTTTDAATVSPFAGVSISDVDFGQTETVIVTLFESPQRHAVEPCWWQLRQFNRRLHRRWQRCCGRTAIDGLMFIPTAHQIAPGGTVATTFTLTVTDTAGATSGDTSTTVIATAVTIAR